MPETDGTTVIPPREDFEERTGWGRYARFFRGLRPGEPQRVPDTLQEKKAVAAYIPKDMRGGQIRIQTFDGVKWAMLRPDDEPEPHETPQESPEVSVPVEHVSQHEHGQSRQAVDCGGLVIVKVPFSN